MNNHVNDGWINLVRQLPDELDVAAIKGVGDADGDWHLHERRVPVGYLSPNNPDQRPMRQVFWGVFCSAVREDLPVLYKFKADYFYYRQKSNRNLEKCSFTCCSMMALLLDERFRVFRGWI